MSLNKDKDNKFEEKKEDKKLENQNETVYITEEKIESVKPIIDKSEHSTNLNQEKNPNIIKKMIQKHITIKQPSNKNNIIENKNISKTIIKKEGAIKNEDIIEEKMLENNNEIKFALDNINEEILNENDNGNDNENIIIKKSYKNINNNNEDNNINNNNINKIYQKTVIKGSNFNNNNKIQNDNDILNREVITTTTTTTTIKKIKNGPEKIIKEYHIEENGNDNPIIEKNTSNISNNNSIYSSYLSFSDNPIHKFEEINEIDLKKYKSSNFQYTLSKHKNELLLKSADFKIERNKSLKEYDISPFIEEEDDEEEKRKNITNIEYLTNNIPILKEDELKELENELNPIMSKYERLYSGIFKQDSKEEITQIKNEIITTSKSEKKTINLTGSVISDISEFNSEIQLIRNKNMNIKELSIEEIKIFWCYLVKKYIYEYNKRYKEYNKIILDAIMKKYSKKNRRLNMNFSSQSEKPS